MNNEWLLAICGGLAIGAAVSVLLLTLGRIAGISGILSKAILSGRQIFSSDIIWRWCFIIGMLLGGALAHRVFNIPLPTHVPENLYIVVGAGLLVGYGVSRGSGCTSGHGICGLSRLSRRSLAATLSFMLAGVVTVFVMRHLF